MSKTAKQSPEPFLFDVQPQVEKTGKSRKTKSVITGIYRLRKTLDLPEDEKLFKLLTRACKEIRAFDRMTDTQKEGLILYVIEVQGASTPTEIAEDTKLGLAEVKTVVKKLLDDGILYRANRYIPGSDRQYTILKSARVKTPEVE